MIDESIVFLVVDDSAALDALSLSLCHGGFRVETYSSGAAFLQAYNGDCPGCLLMDFCMSEMNGLEVQQELIKRNIRMPIVFMVSYGTILKTASDGTSEAVEFLEKPFCRSTLFERILRALNQDYWIRASADPQFGVHEFLDEDLSLCYKRFTPVEWQIITLFMAGKSSLHIAKNLELSLTWIDAYLAELMKKLRASSFEELQAIFTISVNLARSMLPHNDMEQTPGSYQAYPFNNVYKA